MRFFSRFNSQSISLKYHTWSYCWSVGEVHLKIKIRFKHALSLCIIKNKCCELTMLWFMTSWQQISAKRGTDSRFILEANLKTLQPKSSRSSILKPENCAKSKHEYKPGSNSLEYHCSHTNTDSCNDLFLPKCEKSWFLKFRLEDYLSRVITPESP